MPPVWGVYFQVADCDASAAKANQLGAKVCVGPEDIPGVGRFALLADPQGAMFSVIRLK
jgi:predicted enzyme related to lactoylglutathione lyase